MSKLDDLKNAAADAQKRNEGLAEDVLAFHQKIGNIVASELGEHPNDVTVTPLVQDEPNYETAIWVKFQEKTYKFPIHILRMGTHMTIDVGSGPGMDSFPIDGNYKPLVENMCERIKGAIARMTPSQSEVTF